MNRCIPVWKTSRAPATLRWFLNSISCKSRTADWISTKKWLRGVVLCIFRLRMQWFYMISMWTSYLQKIPNAVVSKTNVNEHRHVLHRTFYLDKMGDFKRSILVNSIHIIGTKTTCQVLYISSPEPSTLLVATTMESHTSNNLISRKINLGEVRHILRP